MAQVLKVSIKGVYPGGEVWSVNPTFHLQTEPDLSYDQLNTIVTAINALTVPSDLLSAMSPDCSITSARVEQRESTGVLVGMAEGARVTPLVGTGTTRMPLQTSIVVSLVTTWPGASGRGRLYWPLTSATLLTGSHRLATSSVDGIADGMETFLSGVENAIETTAGAAPLAVWSRKNLGMHAVIKLRVGNIPDVQRRRRDTLAETYKVVDYSA